jgi:hypothetical protein
MQRAFALDVLVRPPWGGSLRVLGTVEEPGAVRQTLITVPGVRLDPRWTLLQCSAQYTVQVDELNHGFFELSSTALGLSDEGCLVDCALAKRVRHQKAGNGFHHYDGHVIRCGSVAQALRLGDLHRWHVLGRVPSHEPAPGASPWLNGHSQRPRRCRRASRARGQPTGALVISEAMSARCWLREDPNRRDILQPVSAGIASFFTTSW